MENLIKYLNKTSEHTFMIPRKLMNIDGDIEYDKSRMTHLHIFKDDEKWFVLEIKEYSNIGHGFDKYKIRELNIDSIYGRYGKNTKNIIKRNLFGDKMAFSIKRKYGLPKVEKIINEMKA